MFSLIWIHLQSNTCCILFSKILSTCYFCWKLKLMSNHLRQIRSSHPEVFCKTGVLRNFANFTGKHLCQNLFFNKVASLRPPTLLRKRFWHTYFPLNFVKFLRRPFYTEHLWWVLLTNVPATSKTVGWFAIYWPVSQWDKY